MKFKLTTDWSLYAQGLNQEKVFLAYLELGAEGSPEVEKLFRFWLDIGFFGLDGVEVHQRSEIFSSFGDVDTERVNLGSRCFELPGEEIKSTRTGIKTLTF